MRIQLNPGTAMALIVAGLAAAGAIGTARGLAVLLRADVGSAIVSSVFASGSSFALWVSPLLIFAGYVIQLNLADRIEAKARGKGKALRRSALHDDLNRLNSLVVSAGYPIVDVAGLPRGTRLRQDVP